MGRWWGDGNCRLPTKQCQERKKKRRGKSKWKALCAGPPVLEVLVVSNGSLGEILHHAHFSRLFQGGNLFTSGRIENFSRHGIAYSWCQMSRCHEGRGGHHCLRTRVAKMIWTGPRKHPAPPAALWQWCNRLLRQGTCLSPGMAFPPQSRSVKYRKGACGVLDPPPPCTRYRKELGSLAGNSLARVKPIWQGDFFNFRLYTSCVGRLSQERRWHRWTSDTYNTPDQ